MAVAELLDAEEILDSLLSQYNRPSSGVWRLLRPILAATQSEQNDVLVAVELGGNVETATGVFLDYIGVRLRVPRPSFESTDTEYFGFEEPDNAVGFDQAPFYSTNPLLRGRAPISDARYRRMLQARFLSLRGSATKPSIEAAGAALFPDGLTVADATPAPAVNVDIVEADEEFYGIVELKIPFLIGLPAGVTATLTRSDS